MKLYYAAGASSQAPHIAFREAGVAITPVAVDLRSKTTVAGVAFTDLNPLGYVPILELDNGATLREVTAILLFVADLAPADALAPAQGTPGRLRLVEWLSFLATEMHQGLRSLERTSSIVDQAWLGSRLEKRTAWIELQLSSKPFLMGNNYSVADIYLWVLSSRLWKARLDSELGRGTSLPALENIRRWHASIAARGAVRATLEFEFPRLVTTA
jgi:glutathione S-transferase